MKNKFLAMGLSVAVLAAFGFGCATEPGNNTIEGTLLGGAIGAGTGAAIGSNNHHTGTGALIGGVAGALLGSMIGNDMDATKQKEAGNRPPPPPGPPQPVVVDARPVPVGPVTFEDVKAMSKQGVGDETIINYIRQTRTVFRMTASSIIELKQAGVSEKVINFMIDTPQMYSAPPPPPPPYRYRTYHRDPWGD